MATLDFEQARSCVVTTVGSSGRTLGCEQLELLDVAGRVLAETIISDRDYPPTDRSVRDGFAIKASDVPGDLKIIGEVRAGESFMRAIQHGDAVEIMTGAPMPAGADAVVMIEHTAVSGDRVSIPRAILPGENVNPCGCELGQHEPALEPGRRLGFAEIALLASLGRSRVRVYAQPKIAIVATGDELIEIAQQPEPHQIRNSNSYSLAAQVRRAGGCPHILGVARDEYNCTRALLERGLSHDLLLLSGGVSAGKYDIVEHVLADLGAEFSFDRVRIQPGQPLVFGRARETFFFGLPGNPVSTMVTFEVFAKAAVELLGGQCETLLPLTRARLATDFRQKPGLTRFLPARLNHDGSELEPVSWHGSGDLAAVTQANAFLVTEPDRESWHAGDLIRVLLK